MTQIETQMTQLRLQGMAQSWKIMLETRRTHELSLSEGLELLLQAEQEQRGNRRFSRLVKSARFRYQASIEELNFDPSRGLDKSLVSSLAMGRYIEKGEAVLITGSAGCGKVSCLCTWTTGLRARIFGGIRQWLKNYCSVPKWQE